MTFQAPVSVFIRRVTMKHLQLFHLATQRYSKLCLILDPP